MKRSIVLAVLLFALRLSGVSQAKPPADTFSMDQWLNGPDRTDVNWEVKVEKPYLSYQQRYQLNIAVNVNRALLRTKPGHPISFIVKVAEKDGPWLPGADIVNYVLPANPPKSIDHISLRAGVYLLPGDYRLAILMYDGVDHTGNIRHVAVHVPALKILPDLDRNLPKVEFPSRIPGMPGTPVAKDPGWSLASGVEYLPIANRNPLRIDVVLDFSELDDWQYSYLRSSTSRSVVADYAYQGNVRRILRIGSVLSHLQPASGCVRVSAVDLARMHILSDRQDSRNLNWNELEHKLIAADHARIDVSVMMKQKERLKFVADFLTKVTGENNSCIDGTEPADPVLIVVSPELLNPRNVAPALINKEGCPRCRVFYLRMSVFGSDSSDPYSKVLAPAQPRRMRFTTPLEFRKVLRDLIAQLQ